MVALAACALLVVACYVWVDRPVAFAVKRYEGNRIRLFQLLTEPPPIVQAISPLVLAILAMRRAWGTWRRAEWTLFVACVSLIVADQFRASLGDVFGRYWPATWHDDNPSLIGDGTYGFHPFQGGDDVGSFPLGHAARITGFAGVWWITSPRRGIILVVVCLPMLVSLVAMNYHFVGDVVAGAFVGGMVATYAVALAGIKGQGDDGVRG